MKPFTNTDQFVDSNSLKREIVKFNTDNIEIIKTKYSSFHFENKNGDDIYIYPAFVIIINGNEEIAIIDIKDLRLTLDRLRFKETENLPPDAKVIEKTWVYVNKHGQPDKRYKYNSEIPIVEYAVLKLVTHTGLNEMYCFSNYQATMDFYNFLSEYQKSL